MMDPHVMSSREYDEWPESAPILLPCAPEKTVVSVADLYLVLANVEHARDQIGAQIMEGLVEAKYTSLDEAAEQSRGFCEAMQLLELLEDSMTALNAMMVTVLAPNNPIQE